MADKEIDETSGVETTGHEWDGIKELNNPLPRWWLIVFYVTIIWSVFYWILMPAWPGLTGAHGWPAWPLGTGECRRPRSRRSMKCAPIPWVAFWLHSSLQEIEDDAELQQFVMAAGDSLFGDNCRHMSRRWRARVPGLSEPE